MAASQLLPIVATLLIGPGRSQSIPVFLANLRRVAEAGITVAMGTDAGNPLTLHGPSVFLEMEALQDKGPETSKLIDLYSRFGFRTLRDALGILCRWHARLTPLLRPRFEEWDGAAALYWIDSHGAPGLRPQTPPPPCNNQWWRSRGHATRVGGPAVRACGRRPLVRGRHTDRRAPRR